jgi:hypothetical protein
MSTVMSAAAGCQTCEKRQHNKQSSEFHDRTPFVKESGPVSEEPGFLAGCAKVCAGAAESQRAATAFATDREADERAVPGMPARQERKKLPIEKTTRAYACLLYLGA